MQTYEDFLKTVDQEDLFKKAYDMTYSLIHNNNASFDDSMAVSVSVSNNLSIEILRQYHEWLVKQLDKQ